MKHQHLKLLRKDELLTAEEAVKLIFHDVSREIKRSNRRLTDDELVNIISHCFTKCAA